MVTLSEQLSGSYNSARLGQHLFEKKHPDRKVHVFNSRSASVGETLTGLKAEELERPDAPLKKWWRRQKHIYRKWIPILFWKRWII